MSMLLDIAGYEAAFGGQAMQHAEPGEDDEELREFLDALHARFADRPFRAADVDALLCAGDLELLAALPAPVAERRAKGGDLTKSLGRYLATQHGRFAGTRRVQRVRDGRTGALWAVQTR